MNFPFTRRRIENRQDAAGNHLLVEGYPQEYNTSEGSEFLDDAIRVHDQPLMYKEEDCTTDTP